MDEFVAFLTPVLFDPNLYNKRRSSEEDIIAHSAVNFYEGGITKQEAEAFYNAMRVPGDQTPISYGLNSKLVKEADGTIHEEVYQADGLYGEAIKAIIGWLEKANEVAENDKTHYQFVAGSILLHPIFLLIIAFLLQYEVLF